MSPFDVSPFDESDFVESDLLESDFVESGFEESPDFSEALSDEDLLPPSDADFFA